MFAGGVSSNTYVHQLVSRRPSSSRWIYSCYLQSTYANCKFLCWIWRATRLCCSWKCPSCLRLCTPSKTVIIDRGGGYNDRGGGGFSSGLGSGALGAGLGFGGGLLAGSLMSHGIGSFFTPSYGHGFGGGYGGGYMGVDILEALEVVMVVDIRWFRGCWSFDDGGGFDSGGFDGGFDGGGGDW
uniref:Uncharacterized protein n=1 Tax=Ditylenchus dipsaci TaxID=166011 RepID=A0A915DZE3_9BILA